MSLTAGENIGSYQVLNLLGAGGMGEVYRAHDTKLKRDVAVKVLPETFSRDPDRVARFQREAQVLASLNHPNIAAIYDVEEANGRQFLVLELVEGETLDAKIRSGPMAVDQAIRIARQIAEALEAAHAKGIVHRDLKPANIKVSEDGAVKVLDFGLAKVYEPEASAGDFSRSPTQMTGTLAGTILGTAAYMSPEQARGQSADAQSDIWAFGCVLYEMLSGKQAFSGETLTDVLGGIVRVDPEWQALPGNTPPLLRLLVRQCLEKVRAARLHHIGDARIQMDAAMTASVMDEAAPGVRRRPWFWIAATGLLLLAAILIPYVAGYFPSASRPTATFRFTVSPPPNTSFNSAGGTNAPYVTLAPNGRMAFIAVSNGKRQIWVRELHSLEARVLPGTEDVAPYPVFWSPDSNFIGFGQLEKLKKIAVSGGLPQTICDAPYYESGTWNRDDVIVFSEVNQGEGPLKRVSAAGGQPEVLTRLDETRKDRGHGFPYFLPDGDHFLFLARAEDAQNSAILAGSLSSGETSVVVKAHSRMAYERAGFLIFTRDAALMAQPFDARKLQVTGPAFPIADKVRYNPGPGQASLAISENGILAYRAGIDQEDTKLVWKDRSGNVVGEFGPLGNYRNPELSPDDRRVAIQRRDLETTADDIWTIEVLRGASIRLTTSEEPDVLPVWSPDGTRILFLRGGALYIQPANGVGSEELLIKGPFRPFDWSSENRIIYQADGTQILSLPLTANPQPELYFKSDSIKSNGQLSPDGRWLAYQSNESGRTEVYVQSFPNPSSRGVASPGGGSSPRWGHAGNELFYVDQERRLVAVKVRKVATGLEFSPPVPLFELELNPGTRHPYDVARDGRFLVLQGGDAGDTPITVVVGWADSLKK